MTYPPLQNRILVHAIGRSAEERTYMAGLTVSVKELGDSDLTDALLALATATVDSIKQTNSIS